MKHTLIIILFAICTKTMYSQNTTTDIIKPILLDKSTLSGVGLKKVNLKDEPEKIFHQKRIYKGKDISIYVVSSETWDNKFTNFWFDEFVYMFHGEAFIKPENGEKQLFYSGDYFFAPKGYTGEWNIKAGNNLHYELSAIANKRADSSLVSKDMTHKLFSREKLSGSHINLDDNTHHTEVLKKGIELTIKLEAEKPIEKLNLASTEEKLIHLLSGQLTITDSENNIQTFYSGDFFVMPKGFKGHWKSEGHGLVKYLTVEKTKHE